MGFGEGQLGRTSTLFLHLVLRFVAYGLRCVALRCVV